MKRIVLVVALATISLVTMAQQDQDVVVAVVAPIAPRQSQVMIQGHTLAPVSVGDTCEYEVRSFGSIAMETETVTKASAGGEYTSQAVKDGRDLGRRFFLFDGTRKRTPLFQYPLTPGKEWVVKYTHSTGVGGSMATALDAKVTDIRRGVVLGQEMILVSMTFRGGYTEYYPGSGVYGGVIRREMVYAPEIRCMVSSEQSVSLPSGHVTVKHVLRGFKNAALSQH